MISTINHEQNSVNFLGQCLTKIKEQHPGLSTLQIANKLGISQPTLSRIENSNCKSTNFNTFFNILRTAYPHVQNYEQLIASNYPEMLETYKQIYASIKENKLFIPQKFENYLTNPKTYEFIMLASSTNGVKKDFIEKQFGKIGASVMKELVDANILELSHNRYTLSSILNFTKDTAQKLGTLLLTNNLNCQDDSTLRGGISVHYNSVNKEKLLPILKFKIETMRHEIDQLLQDPQYAGNDVVWSILALDTLNSTETFNGDLQ